MALPSGFDAAFERVAELRRELAAVEKRDADTLVERDLVLRRMKEAVRDLGRNFDCVGAGVLVALPRERAVGEALAKVVDLNRAMLDAYKRSDEAIADRERALLEMRSAVDAFAAKFSRTQPAAAPAPAPAPVSAPAPENPSTRAPDSAAVRRLGAFSFPAGKRRRVDQGAAPAPVREVIDLDGSDEPPSPCSSTTDESPPPRPPSPRAGPMRPDADGLFSVIDPARIPADVRDRHRNFLATLLAVTSETPGAMVSESALCARGGICALTRQPILTPAGVRRSVEEMTYVATERDVPPGSVVVRRVRPEGGGGGGGGGGGAGAAEATRLFFVLPAAGRVAHS